MVHIPNIRSSQCPDDFFKEFVDFNFFNDVILFLYCLYDVIRQSLDQGLNFLLSYQSFFY